MEQLLESKMKSNHELNSKDWVILFLICVCIIFLSFNIALLLKYSNLARKTAEIQKNENKRKSNLQKLYLQEIEIWQSEIFAIKELENAINCFENKNYIDMSIYAEKAISKNKNLVIAYYVNGIAKKEQGFLDESLNNFSNYLVTIPSSPSALTKRAEIYLLQNKKDLALIDLEQALNENSDFEPAKKMVEKLK